MMNGQRSDTENINQTEEAKRQLLMRLLNGMKLLIKI